MNFIVTGGAGFVGSHLVEYLLDKGHSVSVIDNLHSGKRDNLLQIFNEIEFFEEDIRNYEKLRSVVQNCDGVFHEAALTVVQESFTKQKEYFDVNVVGTENIFKLAKEFNFKVVYASSSSVYGNTVKIPIKEDHDRKPINPYGETKLQDEILAEKYSKLGVKIIGLRYFNIYGKRQTPTYAGVITKFLNKIANKQSPEIFGNGKQIRDFVNVRDVAKANVLAMKSDVPHAFINIGTGKSISILELAHMIIEFSGLDIKPIFKDPLEGDVNSSQADVGLAKTLLNWSSEKELKDWLKEVITKN